MDIPNVGKILGIMRNGQGRDTGVNGLIELVVNAWRVNTDNLSRTNRVVQVSDILKWAEGNGVVRSKIPKCPKSAPVTQSAPVNRELVNGWAETD